MIKWGVKRNQGKYLKSPKHVYSSSGNSKRKQQKQSQKTAPPSRILVFCRTIAGPTSLQIYSTAARDSLKFSFHQWPRALLFKSSWNQFWGRGNIQARIGRQTTCRRWFLQNKYSICSDCRNCTRRRLLCIRLRMKFWIAKSTGYCCIKSRRTTARRPYISWFAISMMH